MHFERLEEVGILGENGKQFISHDLVLYVPQAGVLMNVPETNNLLRS
jgi:hypothetical protein